MNLKQLIAFAILMENNDGILGKSPDYILEKYEGCQSLAKPEGLLDLQNKAKFQKYMERWRVSE